MPPKLGFQIQCQDYGRYFQTIRGRSQHQRQSNSCELPDKIKSAQDEITNLINAARDADDVQCATAVDSERTAAADACDAALRGSTDVTAHLSRGQFVGQCLKSLKRNEILVMGAFDDEVFKYDIRFHITANDATLSAV